MFDFGQALTEMKGGNKVKRQSWRFNAEIALMPGSSDLMANITTSMSHSVDIGEKINVAPCFTLYNKNENCLYAWTPRTVDILAEDWMLSDD